MDNLREGAKEQVSATFLDIRSTKTPVDPRSRIALGVIPSLGITGCTDAAGPRMTSGRDRGDLADVRDGEMLNPKQVTSFLTSTQEENQT